MIKNNTEFKKSLEIAQKHLAKNDKIIASLIEKYGNCNLKRSKKYYEFLLRSIISQQLSNKVASKIFERFKNLFNSKKFIDPFDVVTIEDEKLKEAGLSIAKIKYVKDLSEKVLNNTIQLKKIEQMDDEEIIRYLTQIKGVGRWTVQMVLIFALGRLNVLPSADQGLKNAIKKLYNIQTEVNADLIENLSVKNNWAPYNTVAAWYIWKSLENIDEK